jgi:hypothetical protein
MLGYVHSANARMSPQVAASDRRNNARPDNGSVFSKAYATVPDFYVDLKPFGHIACDVYVDYPKNVATVLEALRVHGQTANLELGESMLARNMRDLWAKRIGFVDYAASSLAESIKADANQIKLLDNHGISTKAGWDAAVAEMRATRYSNEATPQAVLAYLDDKKSAGRGLTALSVKQTRERAAAADAERRTAEERRQKAAHAKEFPFTATLTCGMGQQHINIMACFSGSSINTQLELRNGEAYRMFQGWEAAQAGRESHEGLVIPLRRDFSIKGQNVADTLLLTIRIKDTVSDKILYEKSAARFGVVFARN